MDETVKDEEPTAEEPEPQFSINDLDIKVSFRMHKRGRTFKSVKVYLKSMNDPDTYELAPHGGVKSNDPRPNMWANPEGNWAKIELNGWNVHHTMGKNWARNANVHLSGWQFSDNHRSYVIKVSLCLLS